MSSQSVKSIIFFCISIFIISAHFLMLHLGWASGFVILADLIGVVTFSTLSIIFGFIGNARQQKKSAWVIVSIIISIILLVFCILGFIGTLIN